MSFSRAHATLRSSTVGNQWIAISVDRTGDHRDAGVSYSERYRGTEHDSRHEAPVVSEPLVSRGRTMVLVLGFAIAAVAAGVLFVVPS